MRPDNSDLWYLLYIVILDPSGEGHAIKPPIFTSCGSLTASQMGSLALEWKSSLLYCTHTHTHTLSLSLSYANEHQTVDSGPGQP